MFQAQQILSTCLEKIDISSTEGYDVFLSQLKDGLKNTSHETAANHKVAKVNLPAPAGVYMVTDTPDKWIPSYRATSPLAPTQPGSSFGPVFS